MTDQVVAFASCNNTFKWISDDVRSLVKDYQTTRRNGQNEKSPNAVGTLSEKKDSLKIYENHAPATYVNQFRMRTAHNNTASVEFFFSSAPLCGEDLIYQLFHVVNQLNNINLSVRMICMDAGGNNSRLASLLRHEKILGESI